jgi:hypothetical protein
MRHDPITMPTPQLQISIWVSVLFFCVTELLLEDDDDKDDVKLKLLDDDDDNDDVELQLLDDDDEQDDDEDDASIIPLCVTTL